jgi:TetR/AcrR family transcriptional regulator of autoinduction and epiphytic fitness
VSDVKQPRGYDNSRRTQLAEQTRTAVLDAARRLFLAKGYAATSVREIADEAGVSFPTVYAAVGNKAALLSRLFDIAVRGDDDPRTMAEREFVRAAEADPDPRATLAVFARHVSAAGARLVPLLAVIDEAAGAHPEIAELAEQNRRNLLAGCTRLVQALDAKGALREGLDVGQAADVVWMLAGGVVQRDLVERRGWAPEAAEEWLASALDRLLLAARPS